MSNGIVPDGNNESITFFEVRAPIWVANAAALGISESAAASLQTLAGAARTALNTAELKAADAVSATAAQNEAIAEMRKLGANLIKGIRLTASMEGDPGLYQIAQIPEPKKPSEVEPVNPSNLRFFLGSNGGLELRWDGLTVRGTSYLVDRAIVGGSGQPGPFSRIATATSRSYTDTTVPAGTVSAVYRVSALKGQTQTDGVQNTAHFTFVFNNGQSEMILNNPSPSEEDVA
ncbi:MAG: hypothetical protein ACIAQU_03170 [Phycisphaerales bacterium JB064]